MGGPTLLTVVGARPQLVKAAAITRAVTRHNETVGADRAVVHLLVHTGQHYDWRLSDVFFDELEIPPAVVHLGVGSASHATQTAAMMTALEPVLVDHRPDAVIVVGDTNSTLAGALTAVKLHLPVVHVEAGLRSYDRTMPEEVNRVVVDHVAGLHLCPSAVSADNLRREGISDGIVVTGDVMLDVFDDTLSSLDERNPVAETVGVGNRPYAVMTVHRPANTDDCDRLRALIDGAGRVGGSLLPVIWPVHPRLGRTIGSHVAPDGVHLVPPASYREMVALLRGAAVVLTDSGGLQKEAYWSRTPCVTLRDTTEWTETLEAGWNRLCPADAEEIRRAVEAALGSPPGGEPTAYGTPGAADRVLQAVSTWLERR